MMPTNNSWNNQVTNANVTFNGGTMSIGTDSTANAINIGTVSNTGRVVTVGNITGTSSVNINTGTGGSAITTTNGTYSVSTGTGAINIGADATAKTVTIGNGTGATSVVVDCGTGALNIGTNAIARTTTIGNTTGASVLALKCGTGDFSLASATGDIIVALDSGEVTKPLQPAFLAVVTAVSNVTGDGTKYTIQFTEVFDQSNDFNGSTTFTAPVTGRYQISSRVIMVGILSTHTVMDFSVETSNRTYKYYEGPFNAMDANTQLGVAISTLGDMDAGDTATTSLTVFNGTKVIDTVGAGADIGSFSIFLAC